MDAKLKEAAEAMFPVAQGVRKVLGVFLSANDSTPWGIAMAWANGEIVRNKWCECEKPGMEFFYIRRGTGHHGWACSRCLGIIQSG